MSLKYNASEEYNKTPCISMYIYVRDEKRQGTTATMAVEV